MFGRDEIRVLNVVQRFDNLRERRSIVGVLTPTHYDKSDHIEITVIYNKMFYDHSYLRTSSRTGCPKQWRSKIDNWEGAGHIHIFVFTDLQNNRLQKTLIMQNTNI